VPEVNIQMFDEKQKLKEQIRTFESELEKAEQMIMQEELKAMKRVLRRLDMCEKTDVPKDKGRVASSISAADEILTTQLLFLGKFNNLDANEAAALCSCLVYTDPKSEGILTKQENLRGAFEELRKTAGEVADVMIECKVDLNKEDYLKSFCPDIMEITYAWCKGATFKEISDMAQNVYEGTIIRAFRRLDELLQ